MNNDNGSIGPCIARCEAFAYAAGTYSDGGPQWLVDAVHDGQRNAAKFDIASV